MEGLIKESHNRAIITSKQNNTFEARLRRILAKIEVASIQGEWSITLSHLDEDCKVALLPFYHITTKPVYGNAPVRTYTFEYGVGRHDYVKTIQETDEVIITISWKVN